MRCSVGGIALWGAVLVCSVTCVLSGQTKDTTNNAKIPATRRPASAKVQPPAGPAPGISQPPTKPAATTPKAPETPPAQDLLKVTIGSSRVSVTRDGSYGVYADLENVSPAPVTIRPAETVLVVQPEVAHPSACVEWEWGIFPARITSSAGDQATDMRIQPNEHYKVFWDLTGQPQEHKDKAQSRHALGTCDGRSQLSEYLGFVPGDYAFTVEGIVYASGTDGAPQAHTYTETATLHVGISQISTAIAAFFGALLAYFVVALQPGRDFDKWQSDLPASGHALMFFVVLRNALSAGLLGAAVTIVASRLSDTQFPVKVSVNDFWGALTIGFVAYFVGSRFILNLANRFAPPSPAGGKPADKPPTPKTGTPAAEGAKPAPAGPSPQEEQNVPATQVY
jgi:hypothetical protein